MEQPIGAVTSDHAVTSDVGIDILTRGGSTVDAAIAMAICNGVRTFHSMGVGGVAFLVIHQKGEFFYIDGQCTAPQEFDDEDEGTGDACKVAIPGEIKAYKLAHEKFGKLPWADLFKPAISMLQEGFPMAESTDRAFYDKYPDSTHISPTKHSVLCSMFRPNGKELRAGDTLHWPNMADTLEGIAEHGPDYLYNSHVTEAIVKELQEHGGKHTKEDFQNYNPRSGTTFDVDLGEFTLHTADGATGGPMVGLALNILKAFKFSPSDGATLFGRTEVFHKIMEALKFVMAIKDEMGDTEDSVTQDRMKEILKSARSELYANSIREKIHENQTHSPEYYAGAYMECLRDKGTSHISVLGPDGDAVALTSTISNYFGCKLMSPSTGIIWNDMMGCFAPKGSTGTGNVASPGKRPSSCMAPIIITDRQGTVRLVIGAAGSHRIIPALTQVIVKLIWLEMPLPAAIEERRIYYNTNSESLWRQEEGFDEDLVQELSKKGHKFEKQVPYRFSVVEAISVTNSGLIQAHADSRKRQGAGRLYRCKAINRLFKRSKL